MFQTLIEILVSRTNKQIEEIKRIYKELYNTSLLDDIEGDTSGNFKYLLLSLHAVRISKLHINIKKLLYGRQQIAINTLSHI